MNVRSAAKQIGCHPRHLRTLIYRGIIKARKVKMRDGNGKVCGYEYDIGESEVTKIKNTKPGLTLTQIEHGSWKRGKKRGKSNGKV